MKKIGFLLLAAGMLFSTVGCEKIVQVPAVPYATATEEKQAEWEQEVPSYDPIPLNVPEVEREAVQEVVEAEEETTLPEPLEVDNTRTGFSGVGYVTGLSAEEKASITLTVEVPTAQHYDLTIVSAADENASSTLQVNDVEVYVLNTSGSGTFIRATVQGIFLEKGENQITLTPQYGSIDLDCLEIVNNDTLYETEQKADDALSNPDASPGAKRLMAFLAEHYGESVISGQHVSQANQEIEQIYHTTGKYPAIRFADLQEYSGNGGTPDTATEIADSLAWGQEGGIVGLMWYWNAPIGPATVYAKDATFSLKRAVTDELVATCSEEQLRQMATDGTISDECYAIIRDIDLIAEALMPLRDADIPVLWRPLHEAGGAWYWWGASGADSYKWLWNLMYSRMTEYHHLNNLIWVWNGQSSEYLVSEKRYDIASVDAYLEADATYGSRYEQFVALRNMVGNKIMGLSECSTIPDVNLLFRDHAVWSYFGLWYGKYLLNPTEPYTTAQQLIETYNSEGVLTREDYQLYCEAHPLENAEAGQETAPAASESEAQTEETTSSDE